jgi:flagellar biosynthetic protein FliO
MIYVQAASALALVLGLMGLFYCVVQRIKNQTIGGTARNQMQVVERLPLGEKRTLLLVRVGDEQFLLGATANRISMLSSVTAAEKLQESPSESISDQEAKRVSRISFRRVLEAIR